MVDINRTIYSLNREQEERHTEEQAKKMELPYINLSNYPIAPEVLNIIPEEAAIQFQFVPYLKIGNTIKIGITGEVSDAAKNFLNDFRNKNKVSFQPTLISRTSYLYGLLAYEKRKQEAEAKLNAQKKEKEESFEDQISDIKSAAEVARKVTTTKLLDVIIMGAIKTMASDIHLEPSESNFTVRYRIDGILQDVVHLPKGQYGGLLSRIKYLSHLRMDLDNQPQDGRFSFSAPSGVTDIRVSVMPSSDGETVVMRLLSRSQVSIKLNNLGFREDALSTIFSAISKPHGLILTSGPTGSGKTTTLYAMLSELNKPQRKIITLEDPIEYKIEGVEQSQVNREQKYDFADGLKAALRQDPDIMMVGEIRDLETAEIAIQAGLTGHLVLSTVHANSAPSVFVRLLDIGVKPFLLSGSINLVMAQRLVRRICENCAEEYQPDPATWQEIKKILTPISAVLSADIKNKLDSSLPKLKKAKGCAKCNNSGFSGRLAILEVFVPDENISKLIQQRGGVLEFDKAARNSGMISMEQDGLIRVLANQTTPDEVWRVTRE